MSSEVKAPHRGPAPSAGRRPGAMPGTPLGWWAVALAAVAAASLVVFPLITVNFRDTYPIVDTWVMPAVMSVLFDAAAILSVMAVWLKRERSTLNLLALALTVPAALFITLTVVLG